MGMQSNSHAAFIEREMRRKDKRGFACIYLAAAKYRKSPLYAFYNLKFTNWNFSWYFGIL